ncbi:hypothetical protein ABT299_44845 [Spirillospora sp. NPDC000708]
MSGLDDLEADAEKRRRTRKPPPPRNPPPDRLPNATDSDAAASLGQPLPEPVETPDAAGPLDPEERSLFKLCEKKVTTLRDAFLDAGKALENIRDRRLYRETHKSFEAYCRERWTMSRVQADRLIRAGRIAAKLKPIGFNPVESQMRAVGPVDKRHGVDAAITVYRTVAEADGVTVTADVLKRVVSVLPADTWDESEARTRIRAYLAGELEPAAARQSAPTFASEANRVRASLRSLLDGGQIRQATRDDPKEVRELVAELRRFLAAIEPELDHDEEHDEDEP